MVQLRPGSASGKASFAVTANFNRYHGDRREQFSLAYQFQKEMFEKADVALQNIVYFHSPLAHYVVATIKDVTTLVRHGVFRERNLPIRQLISRNNTNMEKLAKTMLSIANDWGVPHRDGFYREGPDCRGQFQKSMAVFEFTKLTSVMRVVDFFPLAVTVGESQESALSSGTNSIGSGSTSGADAGMGRQVIALVGDAAFSPFWPEGTGGNQAIVGALQQVFNLIEIRAARAKPKREVHAAEAMVVDKKANDRKKELQSSSGAPCNRNAYQFWMKRGYDGGTGVSWILTQEGNNGEKGLFDQ